MSTPAPSDNPTPRLALTLDETAKSIGISRRTAWTLVNSGQLPACRVGGRWLVPVKALEAWLADRAAEHSAGAVV